MTGLHSGHAYIRGNEVDPKYGGDLSLRANDTTFPELLQQAGYMTILSGKWGLGENNSMGAPNLKGFDYFLGDLDQKDCHIMYPPYLWENKEILPLSGNTQSGALPSRERCMGVNGSNYNWTHDVFTNAAMKALTERAEEPDVPFFLFVSWTDPHAGGWHDYVELYAETGQPVPSDGDFNQQDEWPLVERDHASVIQNYQDRDVGSLVDLIDELGLGPSTLIIFASDNGASNEGGNPHDGFHSYQFFNSSGPLQGFKRSVYEGGIRSPTIARWPGTITAGSVSQEPWYFADFMSTALDLAEAPDLIPSNTDGVSIAPLLRGEVDTIDRGNSCIYFEFCTNIEGIARWGRAGRVGNWKAVSASSEQPLELYNVQDDPGETSNLATEEPDILANLKTCMDSQHVDSAEFPMGDYVCTPS